MKVLLVEPYYIGSHKYWADNLINYSTHEFILHTLTGKHWKWRMQGSAITLADMYNESDEAVDIILCSTMIDLALYRSLIEKKTKRQIPPIIYYMHENQLTYPFSINEDRNQEEFHYGFINYKSCLVADAVVFNTSFHQNQFLAALTKLLKRLPDYKDVHKVTEIKGKSKVIPVGLDLKNFKTSKTRANERIDSPTLLWNHRWDTDKNPQLFFDLCYYLKSQSLKFKLILLGKAGNINKCLLESFRSEFRVEILHSGYVENYGDYLTLLKTSDIIPVTSDHDFYGISVMEAIISGVKPLLPRGKVYEEFLPFKTYSDLYFSSHDELFIKTKDLIYNFSPLDEIPDALLNQDMHKQIKIYDLYIKNILHMS